MGGMSYTVLSLLSLSFLYVTCLAYIQSHTILEPNFFTTNTVTHIVFYSIHGILLMWILIFCIFSHFNSFVMGVLASIETGYWLLAIRFWSPPRSSIVSSWIENRKIVLCYHTSLPSFTLLYLEVRRESESPTIYLLDIVRMSYNCIFHLQQQNNRNNQRRWCRNSSICHPSQSPRLHSPQTTINNNKNPNKKHQHQHQHWPMPPSVQNPRPSKTTIANSISIKR